MSKAWASHWHARLLREADFLGFSRWDKIAEEHGYERAVRLRTIDATGADKLVTQAS